MGMNGTKICNQFPLNWDNEDMQKYSGFGRVMCDNGPNCNEFEL